MVKYLIIGIAVMAFGVVIHAQNSCHLRELDLCVASGLASGQNLPTTVAEINKQCQGLKEMNDCIGNYSRRCSTKSMREFLRSITTQGDVQSWHQNFCEKENSEERQQYLKHATCLNQAQKEARTCMRDLTVALDRAINNDVEKRIPEMCCAVRRMRKCNDDIVENKCGKEGKKYMNQMVQSIAGTRLPEIACRDFDPTSKKCTSILPAPGTKAGNTRSNSVLSRLLNTYSAL
ncbi:uncharacterized protein LOC113796858 [Dermatophagoides pteronyssinus]|uniref:Uncharacterized protein n=2 Tax=Dermatophagoides pteronyssinus TaxID=6956 RepID=A0ABQ8IYY4_DERPT|nr:uncharacterized protein LOC113796858 [Dermatophagoides pteronyssinus]KAH9415406.1 hypothetical protein DERP_012704 [Dermatophagoides pteronyssinus]